MPTLWFCLVAVMLAVYVVLDGFDIGAGIVHLLVAKTNAERRAVLASIGPVWDGNEVWLIAAGGTLYFAFPGLYAASFSGFYLALMMVLWLLILRGISIEVRSHIDNPMWHSFWDVVFSCASLLLALFFGAALGNVVRGVPIDGDGYFFVALWTNLLPGRDPGIIDWYTVSVGMAAVIALTLHGALWVALKTEGDLPVRCRRLTQRLWWIMLGLILWVTFVSFAIQPLLARNFALHAWTVFFPAAAAGGLIGMRVYLRRELDKPAFFSSCTFILGLLSSAAVGLYPYLLPSNVDPARSLTISNAAAPPYGLQVGLFWFIPAFILAGGYSIFVYKRFAGKVETGG